MNGEEVLRMIRALEFEIIELENYRAREWEKATRTTRDAAQEPAHGRGDPHRFDSYADVAVQLSRRIRELIDVQLRLKRIGLQTIWTLDDPVERIILTEYYMAPGYHTGGRNTLDAIAARHGISRRTCMTAKAKALEALAQMHVDVDVAAAAPGLEKQAAPPPSSSRAAGGGFSEQRHGPNTLRGSGAAHEGVGGTPFPP